MPNRGDPFERAVAREGALRRRAEAWETRSGVMRLVLWWLGALGAGWALLVSAHWVVFPEPRWLVVLHTVGFVLTAGYWLFGVALLAAMKRRRPDMFEETSGAA